MKFISRYSKSPRSGYNPKTGARPEMQPTAIRGQAGSDEQAESQIEASPVPFQNPRGVIRGVGRNEQFASRQVQGTPAPNLRPGSPHRAAPRTEPMSHGAAMAATGHKPDYRGGYAPSTHSKAKARILRGQIKGAKPLVDNSDIFTPEGIAAWNAGRRGV